MVVVLFFAFLGLGWWQVMRAQSGNLRSYGYAAEWPLFAGFLIFFWMRILRMERAALDRRRGEAERAEAAGDQWSTADPSQDRLQDAFAPWGPTPLAPELEPDPELDAYNAYLASLAAGDADPEDAARALRRTSRR